MATYSVKTFAFKLCESGLANPKSQIFKSQFELTSKFRGFFKNITNLILNLYERFVLNGYILILLIVDKGRIYNVPQLMVDHF